MNENGDKTRSSQEHMVRTAQTVPDPGESSQTATQPAGGIEKENIPFFAWKVIDFKKKEIDESL